jgi:phosphoserine aminotransferase
MGEVGRRTFRPHRAQQRQCGGAWAIVEERSWLGHLAADPATRSTTSVCLTVEGADEAFIKAMAGALEKEGAAYDIAGYRDAPAGLRIWCGATVETADVEALGPWLDWAYAATKAAVPHNFPVSCAGRSPVSGRFA